MEATTQIDSTLKGGWMQSGLQTKMLTIILKNYPRK